MSDTNDDIQVRANEWYANNVSPQSEYPDGALWTWAEVADFAAQESAAAVKKERERLFMKMIECTHHEEAVDVVEELCKLIDEIREQDTSR